MKWLRKRSDEAKAKQAQQAKAEDEIADLQSRVRRLEATTTVVTIRVKRKR